MTASPCFASTPYLGSPFSEPGTRIDAVYFDAGASGDAYSCGDPQSPASYPAFRNTPVQISTNSDLPGTGYSIGNNLLPGDFYAYTCNFTTGGTFDITLRTATANQDGTGASGRFIHLLVDGVNVTGSINLPPTSSWNNYASITIPAIAITAGTHKIELVIETPVGEFNVNWMNFAQHVSKTLYVSSSSGSDGNPGTQASPFATVAYAETQQLSPGDSVLFKRGDTWREVLNPLCSGNASAQITFGAYGSGANPKFWGSNQIPVNDSAWSPQGGNVYTLSYATQVNTVLANQQFLIDIYNGGTGDGSVVRDPTNTPNCWKWSSGTLTISTSNGDDPRTDGKQYDVAVRDNVICDGSQQSGTYENYLTFDSLDVDECGSNANPTLGYGIRIEGNNGTVSGGGYGCIVSNCHVYRYGRHAYAVIDGNAAQFINDYCAYPMPNEQTGQTGFVSFGNSGANLTETSTYLNCTAEHMADTWAGRNDFEYEAFTDHGNSLAAVSLNNFNAPDSGGDGTGEGCTFDAADGASVVVTGGSIFSNTLQTLGPGVIVNGMTLNGPYSNMDLAGTDATIENCLVTGSIDETANSYEAAIWDRGDSNTFRYNTVVCGSAASTGFATVALTNLGSTYGTNFSMYGNILLDNGKGVETWNSTVSFDTALDEYNIFQNGATFYINFANTYSLSQWQSQGYETHSIQVTNPLTTLFTNAAGGSYTEATGSPSIDFLPTSVSYPPNDIAGGYRPVGSGVDAGAYEKQVPSSPVITSPTTASGTVGSAFTYDITATGSPTSYNATGLPTGLSVNTTTGVISGTPTTAGNSSVALTAVNGLGTGSATLALTISSNKPVITSATTASGTTGTVFSYQITATNNPTSYNATGLPAGLSVSTSTGIISGTPTAAGTFPVTLSATNAGGAGTAALSITIAAAAVESPYGGTAWPIPGMIQAENYDLGGENVGYYDTDAGNDGGLYRTDDVDIVSCSDTGGGYQVGYTAATEYLKYTVNVATSQNYDFQVRGASGASGGTIHFLVDGANVTGTMTIPGTGSYQTYTTVTKTGVALTAGSHIIELYEESGGFDLNWFNVVQSTPAITSSATASGTVGSAFSYTITATNTPTSYSASGLPAGLSVNTSTGVISGTPTTAGTSTVTLGATNSGGTGSATLTITVAAGAVESPYGGTAWAIPGMIQAENYDIGGENVAYYDTDAGNDGGQYRSDDVDIVTCSDTGGGYQVGFTAATEYLKYTVNVATSQNYDFQVRGASGASGGTIHFLVDGANVTGTMTIPGTGSYQTYTTVTKTGVALTAGSHIIELYEESGGFDLNWFNVVQSTPVITSATTKSGTVGSAFSYTITATNTPTSYSASGLPAGLSVNTSTGVISGTPTTAGVSSVTLGATNAGGTGSATLTITITVAAPVITSATTKSGTVGSAFSYTITATNTPTSYSETGTLPAGLSLNTSTGVISGTPTTAGTTPITIKATNAGGTGSATLTITISAASGIPVISSATTKSGTVGTAFSYTITASNTPTSYNATSLPAGLSVNTSTGVISGTPTTQGVYSVTISATNASGTGSATLTITISTTATSYNVYALWTPGTTITNGGVDQDDDGYNSSLVGTSVTYAGIVTTLGPANAADAWSNTTVSLPPGTYTKLNMIGSAVDGIVTGQTFTVNYTDGSTQTFTQNLSDWGNSQGFSNETVLTNVPTALGPTGAAIPFQNFIYGYTFTLNGKSVKSITLPSNRQVVALAFSTGTGGTAAKPVISSRLTASGTPGTAFSYNITASNSPTSYSETGTLPAGLTFSTSTGVISGTPTTQGVSTVTIGATNAAGTGTASLTITISSAGTAYNVYAIWTPGTTITNGGADQDDNGYNANLVGSSVTYAGSTFSLSPVNAADAWSNVTVILPAGNYTSLRMVGSAVDGIVTGQVFTVNYTDGSTQTFTQNLSDWGNSQGFSNETVLTNEPTILQQNGTSKTFQNFIYGYTFALNGKSVQSITLPNTRQVIAFGFQHN